MWCYQKPGFEALLLTELQRQQQCSQFCDTLLKTDGVSVPAHSCILSAISPNISSALSSMPPPPAGQSHLLEFRALGACTLLHMVRLLYSGEMAGEGEEEKQQAISAAAKLGISGLVEVTRRDRESRHEEGEGRHSEAGVQTEPLMFEEDEGRRGRWRRQVRDGSTFLWKETLSEGEKDTWTQTEELQVNADPPSHPAASFETIDLTAFQSLGQAEPHLLPPQIPYVPISLVYPLGENQTQQLSSAPAHSMQESTAAGHTSVPVVAPPYTSAPPSILSFSNQVTPCAADPQSWWAGSHRATRDVIATEELEDGRFEQFKGNIPGYINYFLNPDKGEHSRGGRARRRQGAGVGGARRAGTGERRARRPQARTGGRGRGGLTQTVDVQEVGVSRLQKLFLHRWGMRVPRTGQGGGAAGRRLCLTTRELLKPAKSCQRRRGRGKLWEFSPSGEVLPYREGGAGNTQRGRRSTALQFNQDDLRVGRAQTAKATPTASRSFSSSLMQLYNVHSLPASGPPQAPHEEQPEHFDRLLEEVMMGLDILPNHNNSASQSQPPLRASSSSFACTSSGQTWTQNRQQGRTTGLLEAGPGFQGSTQVVTVARGAAGSCSANREMPVLQQQGDGELNEMLERFLLSFEQHVDNCSAREEVVMGGHSYTEAPDGSFQITEQQRNDEAETPARRSRPCKASSVRSGFPSKHTAGTLGKDRAPTRRRKRRIKNHYLFSLERKRVRVGKTALSRDTKAKIVKDQRDKQLQLMPVVKLERSGPLPVRVTLQRNSHQSLGVKVTNISNSSPLTPLCAGKSKKQGQTSSSSVKSSHENQPAARSTKTYPIRSRLREAHIDSMLILEQPLVHKRSRGRPRKNGQLLSLSNIECSPPPISPQPLEVCGTEDQLQKNQERDEEELTVQPEEEAESPARIWKKRGAKSEEETCDDATVAKRVCLEQTPQPTSETSTLSSEPLDVEPAAIEIEDVIDVETISLTSVGDCSEREEREEKSAWREIDLRETEESLMDKEVESSADEMIDVDGDEEDGCQPEAEKGRCQSRTASTQSHFIEVKPFVSPPSHSEVNLRSTEGWEEDKDEDIDVTGGSCPIPDPMIISWTESSEGEKEEGDEDVDIVGEMTNYASSAVFATVGDSKLVTRKYQTSVLLH